MIVFIPLFQSLQLHTPIKDLNGKTLPAIKVFSESIKYLANKVYKSIKDAHDGIRMDDIRYVLTVPAIWDDAAKKFMQEAAYEVKSSTIF